MNVDELYMILGKLTLHYTKVELLAANIAKEIGMVDNPHLFFAERDSRRKIQRMRKHAHGLNEVPLKKALLNWLDSFDTLREERNSVTHSIILWNSQNSDEYVLFGFDIKNGELNRSVIGYDSNQFIQLEERLRDVHNRGFEIFAGISRAGHLLQSPRL